MALSRLKADTAREDVLRLRTCLLMKTDYTAGTLGRAIQSYSVVNVQGGSNMTGTNCDLFTHSQSRSYLNHLVHTGQQVLGRIIAKNMSTVLQFTTRVNFCRRWSCVCLFLV